MSSATLPLSLLESYCPEGKRQAVQRCFSHTLEFTSLFDITRFTKAQFKAKVKGALQADEELAPLASDFDSDALYDDARCLAAQISHLYREEQTSTNEKQHLWHASGMRALDDRYPTYTHLFKDNWDDACKNHSIAAIDSPVAYLRALYLLARQLEESPSDDKEEMDKRILLAKRRPDLADLVLNQQSAFSTRPTLEIVNEILDKSIQKTKNPTGENSQATYEILARTCYPFLLPYEFHHHRCLLGLGEKKTGLGELNYLASEYLPLKPSLRWWFGSDSAQELMSGLSPNRQKVLVQQPNENEINDTYWKKIYGLKSTSSLQPVTRFLTQTELSAEQLEALLAQGKYVPALSPNSSLTSPLLEPFGARFVNGPLKVNAIPIRLNKEKLENVTDEQFDRLHRMIRLQRWLDMPFAELDSLVCNTFDAQFPFKSKMNIDQTVIRALGVYRYLNREYSLKAEEFAALLHEVSAHATVAKSSLFDRTFNPARVFQKPLILDGSIFKIDDSDPGSHSILQHLSAGLGLPLTDDSLLQVLKNTEKHLGSLRCNLTTFSAIYRQTRIARMLDLSIADCSALANILDAEDILKCLATGNTDTRTLRISIKRGDSFFRIHAKFALPSEGENTCALLPGSYLITNDEQWFHPDATKHEIDLNNAKDRLGLKIDGFPRPEPNVRLSLQNFPLTLTGTLEQLFGIENLQLLLKSHYESGGFSSKTSDSDFAFTWAVDALNLPDVLMQMDWLTRWIRNSAYDIPALRRILETASSADYPLADLQQHLTKLRDDTRQCRVSPKAFAALSLPVTIQWRELIEKKLLSSSGLIKNFAPSIKDDASLVLGEALDEIIYALPELDADPARDSRLKTECKSKLHEFLMQAHDRQQHLVEEFLQQTAQLPMNVAKDVLVWAKTSVYRTLGAAITTADSHALGRQLHSLLRHTEAAVRLQLSNKALSALLSNGKWMNLRENELGLSFETLYLLDRFNHFITTYQQKEENLLDYLVLANSEADLTVINTRLAGLMNWTTAEVDLLASGLLTFRARTLQDIDWIMRCHNACQSSGLSASALLKARNLVDINTTEEWKAVGDAVMAASL